MQLTSIQLTTVNDILNLYNPEKKVVCEFKAPTGSGKTLMASYFISAMINNNDSDNFIFVIATPSSSSLPAFFEQKLNKYKVDLPFSKFDVEYIQSPSSAKIDKTEAIQKILPEKNKVYIFGKSSFGKGRILSEYKIIDDFVISAVDKGYKLIYIRDEAHIGGEKKDNSEEAQNFESLMTGKASFVLKMTATPDFMNPQTKKIVLKESTLNNPLLNNGKFLLKTHLVSLLNKNLEDTELLEDAIKNFKKIKLEYAKLNIGIRPAMLIQVDNDSATDKIKSQLFNEALESIKKKLTSSGLAWVQYFGNNDKDSNRVYKNNFTLDDITENNNEIDVIIFKIGPATGWDIPRACMLVQIRNVSSSNLNIQTIGRIKRNPYPNLERPYNDVITDNYYIYSNAKEEDYDLMLYNYQVRQKFENETFLSIDIANKKDLSGANLQPNFIKLFKDFLSDYKHVIHQQVNEAFVDGGEKYVKILNSANGKHIYSTVTNPFIFLRDYQRLIAANKYIYGIIRAAVEDFTTKEKLQKEFVFTILLNNYKKDILDIVSKTRICNPTYKITEQQYDPKSYIEIFSERQEREEKVSKRDYLFDINGDDTVNGNRQPLDSDPEKVVYNKVYEFSEDSDAVKLWAKNQTTSNIFGEYLDDANNIRHSYFDFIIKFKNDFYLYVEVKGDPDIDEEKTALLKKAYADYFENNTRNLFSPQLAIAVFQVNKKGNIKFDIFYDKVTINDDLNKMSVDLLLNKLSSLEVK